MSQVGVIESYIPGLEEIADEFIKLCKDQILDKNNELTLKVGTHLQGQLFGFQANHAVRPRAHGDSFEK